LFLSFRLDVVMYLALSVFLFRYTGVYFFIVARVSYLFRSVALSFFLDFFSSFVIYLSRCFISSTSYVFRSFVR